MAEDGAAGLDAYVAAGAAVLELPLAPEWRPAVCGHLAVMLELAVPLLRFSLPDDAEPAPIFQP